MLDCPVRLEVGLNNARDLASGMYILELPQVKKHWLVLIMDSSDNFDIHHREKVLRIKYLYRTARFFIVNKFESQNLSSCIRCFETVLDSYDSE